jgi:hypothetical protein
MPVAALLPRTKAGHGYGWGAETMRHVREAFGTDPVSASAVLGRICKVMDDDVQLLYLAGIALDRMEMRHYVDEHRHQLMVDRKVVREYTVTFTLDGEALKP